MSIDVKEIDRHLIALVPQHAGNRQGITAVVALSGKDDDRHRIIPCIRDGTCQCFGGTLHQIDTGYRLMFDSVSVKLFYLCTGEYFHCKCKNKKNILNDGNSLTKNL